MNEPNQQFIPLQLPPADLANFRELLHRFGPVAKGGSVSVTHGATAQAVAHGLPGTPSVVVVSSPAEYGPSGPTAGNAYQSSTPPDETNIYLANDFTSNINAIWYALYLP